MALPFGWPSSSFFLQSAITYLAIYIVYLPPRCWQPDSHPFPLPWQLAAWPIGP